MKYITDPGAIFEAMRDFQGGRTQVELFQHNRRLHLRIEGVVVRSDRDHVTINAHDHAQEVGNVVALAVFAVEDVEHIVFMDPCMPTIVLKD